MSPTGIRTNDRKSIDLLEVRRARGLIDAFDSAFFPPIVARRSTLRPSHSLRIPPRLVRASTSILLYLAVSCFPTSASAAARALVFTTYLGGGQTGKLLTALTGPIVVRVTAFDADGNAVIPVPGLTVGFNVTPPLGATGYSVSNTVAVTGADGTASTFLTLGSLPGPYLVTVAPAAPSCPPVTCLLVGGPAVFTESAVACPVNVILSATGIGDTDIFATITPPSGTTLDATAQSCGFDRGFNFIQTVTADPYPPASALTGNLVTVPYRDPVDGGYLNQPLTAGKYPFYYSTADLLTGFVPLSSRDASLFGGHVTICPEDSGPPVTCVPVEPIDGSSLTFRDAPATKELVYPQFLAFQTDLVGISSQSGSPGATPCSESSPYWCTILFSFTWTDDFNGTVLGGSARSNLLPVDPNSGTGGVTITGINGVQFPSAVPPDQLLVTTSGLAYSRVSQAFIGTVTVENSSSNTIIGPLQILYFGVPAQVTLVNATGNFSGTPYQTVSATGGLGPGQSVTVSVQFKAPLNAIVDATPIVYSGSF
jgi:hypothetical protein